MSYTRHCTLHWYTQSNETYMRPINPIFSCDVLYFWPASCRNLPVQWRRIAKWGLPPHQSLPIHRDANRQSVAYCSQVPFSFHLSVLSYLFIVCERVAAADRPKTAVSPRSGPQQSGQKHPNPTATSWDVPNYDCRGGMSVFQNGENSVISYQIHDGGTPFWVTGHAVNPWWPYPTRTFPAS